MKLSHFIAHPAVIFELVSYDLTEAQSELASYACTAGIEIKGFARQVLRAIPVIHLECDLHNTPAQLYSKFILEALSLSLPRVQSVRGRLCRALLNGRDLLPTDGVVTGRTSPRNATSCNLSGSGVLGAMPVRGDPHDTCGNHRPFRMPPPQLANALLSTRLSAFQD